MMQTIERLCADDFAGRRTGSLEHYLVVDYLVDKFKAAGLDPLEFDEILGYRQPFTMRYALIDSKDDIKATLSYNVGGAPRTHTFAYRMFNGNGGLDIHSNVVFVGHGVHDPGSGYDDYAEIDVEGKVVLWLPGKPSGIDLKAPVTDAHKIMSAYQRGAVACLIYAPDGIGDAKGTNIGLAGTIADFPYMAIDKEIVSDIMKASSGASSLAKVSSGIMGAVVEIHVTPVSDPERRTYNVLGMIPGADPEVAHEAVILGAHYDHLGVTPSDEVFRGADDNASGVSVILEVARSIREAGLYPRRTIVFAAWSGEEVGLLGSNHFVANLPFPSENIVSKINLDMVGVGIPGEFMTTGARAFPEHYWHIESSGRDLGYNLVSDVIVGPSDHLAFTRKGIPASLIHSTAERPHFHTIRDTPEIINPQVVESAAKLTVLALWRAANTTL